MGGFSSLFEECLSCIFLTTFFYDVFSMVGLTPLMAKGIEGLF